MQCSLLTILSRSWIVLFGWRPSVLCGRRSTDWVPSAVARMMRAMDAPTEEATRIHRPSHAQVRGRAEPAAEGRIGLPFPDAQAGDLHPLRSCVWHPRRHRGGSRGRRARRPGRPAESWVRVPQGGGHAGPPRGPRPPPPPSPAPRRGLRRDHLARGARLRRGRHPAGPPRARARRRRRLPGQPHGPQPRPPDGRAGGAAQARHAQPVLRVVDRPGAPHAGCARDVRPRAAHAGARRRPHRPLARARRQPRRQQWQHHDRPRPAAAHQGAAGPRR